MKKARTGIDRRRRRFVVSLTKVAGGLGCVVVLGRCAGRPGEGTAVLQVAERLTVPGDARLVGGAYLEQVPEEHDRDRLVDLLLQSLRMEEAPPSSGQLAERVLAAVRRDFEEDRIVRIQGWMLSLTEARLCALVAISAEG
jgi:hypothetical protein